MDQVTTGAAAIATTDFSLVIKQVQSVNIKRSSIHELVYRYLNQNSVLFFGCFVLSLRAHDLRSELSQAFVGIATKQAGFLVSVFPTQGYQYPRCGRAVQSMDWFEQSPEGVSTGSTFPLIFEELDIIITSRSLTAPRQRDSSVEI